MTPEDKRMMLHSSSNRLLPSSLSPLLRLLLLIAVSGCDGDSTCTGRQSYIDCINKTESRVVDVVNHPIAYTDSEVKYAPVGSTETLKCHDLRMSVIDYVHGWNFYPSDPDRSPIMNITTNEARFTSEVDCLVIRNLQPRDEGVYLCEVTEGSNPKRMVFAGCVIVHATVTSNTGGTLSVTRGNDVTLPTRVIFENAGFCNVTPVYTQARLRYEPNVDILFLCQNLSCVIDDDQSSYNFPSLGDVVVRGSHVIEGPYLMAIIQDCPSTVLRMTYDVTFTSELPSPSLRLRTNGDMILVGEEAVVYCDIDLIGVMWGDDVTVDVTWFRDRVPVSTDWRVIISGVTGGVGGGVHSSLTFSPVLFSDMATYECRVTITPLLGPASPVSSSAFLLLDITEPVDPVRPEDITFRDVKSDSVIVQWTVGYISYSPETYVVQYGTSRDSLIHNSSSTLSEEDVMTYSVEVSGLRENTTYYVQVVATNTAGRSNRSSVESFTILLSSEMPAGGCSSSSATENTEFPSVVGGVLSLIIILIAGVSTILIILFILKIRTLKSMLDKVGVRDAVDVDSKSVPTASNAAYGVVSHDQRSGGDVAMYEMVGQPASSSARPTADPPSDYLQPSQGPPTEDPAYDVIAGH